MEKYTYLLLNIATISFPFLWSFEGRMSFYKNWYALFPAIALTAAIFITWDHYFTDWGIWGFNLKYITGISFFGLPIEEWLFFFTVPYACIFIYESLNYYFKKNIFYGCGVKILLAFQVLAITMAVVNINKWYTSTAFFLASILLPTYYLFHGQKMLEKFFVLYLVHLIPFFIVNGALTALPVVTYNNEENLAIRMGTIPVEDAIYSMCLLLMNLLIYEILKSKSFKPIWQLN